MQDARIEKIKSQIEANYPVQDSFIFKAFINALYQNTKLLDTNLKPVWTKIWSEQILIDNISHSIIVRKGKSSVHETLQTTTARICQKLNIIISATLFSHAQLDYLQSNSLPIPTDHQQIPSTCPPPQSITETALTTVRSISQQTGATIEYQQYPTETLLAAARKRILNNTIINIIETKQGIREEPATGPWAKKGDQLEMLKKTAVRKFIKYFCQV